MTPIPAPYTDQDFLAAIKREMEKRKVTYPKIVERKKKHWQGSPNELFNELLELTTVQRIQLELLLTIETYVENRDYFEGLPEDGLIIACFRELQRELRQRNSIYPRWIRWGMMDPVVATAEINVWSELTKWFHQAFCPNAPWRKPPTRKPKSVHHTNPQP